MVTEKTAAETVAKTAVQTVAETVAETAAATTTAAKAAAKAVAESAAKSVGTAAGAAVARATEKLDRRVVKTRAAIQAAFRKLVKERGINKVTVSELARAADIDRKTFYLHYDSIDDLIDNEADQIVGRILSCVDQSLFECDPRAQIDLALSEINVMIREDIDLYTYIANNLSLDFMLEHITKALDRWFEEHAPRATVADFETPDFELHRYRLRLYLAGAASVYGAWLQSDRTMPLESISEMVGDALVVGLSLSRHGTAVPQEETR